MGQSGKFPRGEPVFRGKPGGAARLGTAERAIGPSLGRGTALPEGGRASLVEVAGHAGELRVHHHSPLLPVPGDFGRVEDRDIRLRLPDAFLQYVAILPARVV